MSVRDTVKLYHFTPADKEEVLKPFLDEPARFSGLVILLDNGSNEKERDLLSNIVSNALGLEMDNVLIIDRSRSPMRLREAMKALSVRKCISFGLLPAEVGLNVEMRPFEEVSSGGISFLCAPSLGNLMGDRDQKMRLWQTLKKMFGIE